MNKISFIFLASIFVSCSQGVEKRYVVKEFSKPIADTLKPIKDEQYSAKIIKIKGTVDDTIFVSFGGDSFKQYLTGKIDTIFNPDFYGETNAVFVFDPYKAEKGEIELIFSIK